MGSKCENVKSDKKYKIIYWTIFGGRFEEEMESLFYAEWYMQELRKSRFVKALKLEQK